MDIRYKRKEKVKTYLTAQNEAGRLHAMFHHKRDILTITFDWHHALHVDKNMKTLEHVKAIIEEASKIGGNNDIGVYHVRRGNIPTHLHDHDAVMNYLGKEWNTTENESEMFDQFFNFPTEVKKGDYYLFEENGEVMKIYDFHAVFEEVIRKRKKEDPTVSIKNRSMFDRMTSYKVYYEGIVENIVIVYDDVESKLLFKSDKGEKRVFHIGNLNVDEWKEEWEKEFDKTYKKQRMKSIFTPPKDYQDKYKRKLSRRTSIQNQIIEDLSKRYNVKELEILFAENAKNLKMGCELFEMEDSVVAISYIGDHLYVYEGDKPEEMFHYNKNEKQEAQKKYRELIEKNAEIAIQNHMKKINGRIGRLYSSN